MVDCDIGSGQHQLQSLLRGMTQGDMMDNSILDHRGRIARFFLRGRSPCRTAPSNQDQATRDGTVFLSKFHDSEKGDRHRYVKAGAATDCGRERFHGKFAPGNICSSGRRPGSLTDEATQRAKTWVKSPAGRAAIAAAKHESHGHVSPEFARFLPPLLGGKIPADIRHDLPHLQHFFDVMLHVSEEESGGDKILASILFAQNLSILKWLGGATDQLGHVGKYLGKYVPVGSLAYLLRSSKSDRLHTLKDAKKAVSLTMKRIKSGSGIKDESTSRAPRHFRKIEPEAVGNKHDFSRAVRRIKKYGDFYFALLSVALGRSGGDLDLSIRVADHAYKGTTGAGVAPESEDVESKTGNISRNRKVKVEKSVGHDIQRAMKSLPPLCPDYGNVFYNTESGKVYIEFSDSDERDTTRSYIKEIGKLSGVTEIDGESEHIPEEIGSVVSVKPPWILVARSGRPLHRYRAATGSKPSRFLRPPMNDSPQALTESGQSHPAQYMPRYSSSTSRFAKAKTPEVVSCLAGRLYHSKSGWGLLKVPNSLVRGLFDAIHEPGVILPPSDSDKPKSKWRLNAHVSVLRPDEIEKAGGPDTITEWGHHFHYQIGPVKKVKPAGWDAMREVYFVDIDSPELEEMREKYGLSRLPNKGKFRFHISIAVKPAAKGAGKTRFAKAGSAEDCGHRQVSGEFDEKNTCATGTGRGSRSPRHHPAGRPPLGGILASANVAEGTDFAYALHKIRSPDQKIARRMSEEIDRKYGLDPKTYNAIGDWSDGAEHSVVSFYKGGNLSLDEITRAAATKGLAWNQKAVIPFILHKGGPDIVYQIDLRDTDLKSIRGRLDEAGIQFRSLIPGKRGTRIVIADDKGGSTEKVRRFGEHYSGRFTAKAWKATIRWDVGADTRSAARKVYRKILQGSSQFRWRGGRLPGHPVARGGGLRRTWRGSHRRGTARTHPQEAVRVGAGPGPFQDGWIVPRLDPTGGLARLLGGYGLRMVLGPVKGNAACRRKGRRVVLDMNKLLDTDAAHQIVAHELGESLCPRPKVKSIPRAIAEKVSKLATKSALNFVGQVFAGLVAGQQYPSEVMEIYRRAGGYTP